MSDAVATQLLYLACGVFLLTAVAALWRRDLAALIRILVVQAVALTAIAVLLALGQHSVEAAGVAVGVGVLKVFVLPALLRRVLQRIPEARETRPRVPVATSLLAAAVLTLLAFTAARPLMTLAPSAGTRAAPVALAVVLLGFFLAATRQRAVSQVVGVLLIDNGIAALAFLSTGGVPLLVELGVSVDLLLVVLVLQVLATRLQDVFGAMDLDELRELHD